MKRVLILLIALLLLPAALAETMAVVNCEEWVSLREAPDTGAARLKKVPLYAWVEDAEEAENGFMRVRYDGAVGYILSQYLEPVEAEEPNAWVQATADGRELAASRVYADGGESMTVTCYDPAGTVLWTRTLGIDDIPELEELDAFLAGTTDDPRAMLYNAREGLMCLDLDTGEVLWTLSTDEINLGAGNAHAVDDQGRMVICGFYGPDPVCIDRDGNVLWQASAGSDDIYWPYAVSLTDAGVVTEYEMLDNDYGRVIYDREDGHVISIEKD